MIVANTPFNHLMPLAEMSLGLGVAGYETIYSRPGEFAGVHYEQLMVTLFQDQNGDTYHLHLLIVNEMLAEVRKEAHVSCVPEYSRTLSFSLEFPQVIQDTQIPDLAYLTLALNRFTELGAFGIHPTDGLYYRYTLAYPPNQHFDLKLIVEIIEEITTYIKGYMVLFDLYLSGTKTLQEIDGIIANHETSGER